MYFSVGRNPATKFLDSWWGARKRLVTLFRKEKFIYHKADGAVVSLALANERVPFTWVVWVHVEGKPLAMVNPPVVSILFTVT